MIVRFATLFATLCLLFAGPAALAQAVGPPAPVGVALQTDAGTITLAIDVTRAPVTGRNFLRYVDQKRLDGVVFYRVMRLDWGTPPNGLIQAGTRGDPRRELPPIAHEPTSSTGLLHKAGAISMARFAPGTAKGDFSILLSDMPGLDAVPGSPDPELAAGYAVFGHVIAGMDVVRAIYDAPLSPTLGEGILKGQMLEKPVRIVSARRVALPLPVPSPEPAAPPTPAP